MEMNQSECSRGAVLYWCSISGENAAKAISQGADGIGTWMDQILEGLIGIYHISLLSDVLHHSAQEKGLAFWKNTRTKCVAKQFFAKKSSFLSNNLLVNNQHEGTKMKCYALIFVLFSYTFNIKSTDMFAS
eukprot:5003733-Ditylum_brightwellii.AAC.1